LVGCSIGSSYRSRDDSGSCTGVDSGYRNDPNVCGKHPVQREDQSAERHGNRRNEATVARRRSGVVLVVLDAIVSIITTFVVPDLMEDH
jgi:hypothetical protein